MFDTLLIANRGEIACRIIRTARRLGVRSVAVYSAADADAPHVRMADAAVAIGPAPSAQSYLNTPALIAAARAGGAQAVHPGYGFLSENAAFAAACAEAGLVFVGPGIDAIRIMGSKREAKAVMSRHGVPLVPGYYGEDQSAAMLAAQAREVGLPLLIKASAGGGGRGMRIVRDFAEFPAALASAQREAQSSFGDPSVLLERYVEGPRHIEVQIFGDTFGNVVHLFERDCSLQRRHQKVIEEAPAVHLSAAQRATLFDASLRAARAVAYVGAGTVEFIIDRAGDVCFIEMNTRLQVEHPVTEAVTGCDLVEWQLRVAAGEPLPATQAELCCSGHAIEIRVYAEDPAQDFRPSTGTLDELALPNGIEGVRVDAGVTRGDAVTPHYDAMIAKIITTGATREAAVRCMQQALAATRIVGVNTNIAYLQRILAHPGYRAGGYSTHFVEEARATLLGRDEKVPDEVWLCAALALVAQVTTVTAGDTSPWARLAGFRLNGQHLLVHQLATPEQVCRATTELRGRGARVSIDERVFEISDYTLEAGRLVVRLASHILQARVVGAAHDLHVFLPTADLARSHYRLKAHDPWHEVEEADEVSGSLVAPMPGAVTAVLVAEGDKVAAGTALLVLEAMKIEHTLRAPFDGTVTALRYRAGEQVAAEGEELIRIERLA